MSTGEDSTAPAVAPRAISPLVQALLTVGLTAAIVVLARAALLLASGQGYAALYAFALLLDWGVLVFVLLVAAITIWRRDAAPRTRAGLYIAAAAIGALVGVGVQAAPSLAGVGPEALLWFVPTILTGAAGFVISATIGALAAVGILASAGRPARGPVITGIGVAALVVGGVLILALIWQAFDVYFSLFGAEVIVTEADGVRYLVTAGFAIALPIVAIVLGRIRRVRAVFGWGIALTAMALVVAFVFQVPAGRFWVDPGGGPPIRNDYVPCFGEGDPNCIGG